MKLIDKRCERCGVTKLYPPRSRRCKELTGLLDSFYCWGHLVTVVKPKRERQRIKKDERPQDVAARNAAAALVKVVEKGRALKQLTESLTSWTDKLAEYERRARMTDDEVAADKAKWKAAAAKAVATRQAKRRRRGIKLEGEL